MNHTDDIVARTQQNSYPQEFGSTRDVERPSGAAASEACEVVAASAATTSLDPDRNKSPLDDDADCVMFVPNYSGGRLDPVGGRNLQIQDLKKIEALCEPMRSPCFITFTIDQKGTITERGFDSPGEAYDAAMPQISRLLTERLGFKHWVRVLEVQKNDWPHWHIVVDLDEFDGSIAKLRRRCWSLWRDKWGFGIVHVDPVRSSVAGYLVGYVTKKWDHIPEWMGESRRRFRIVGYSAAAGRRIRERLNLSVRTTPRRTARNAYRRTRTLYERLAASGLSTHLILRRGGESQYLATIPGDTNTIAVFGRSLPWLVVTVVSGALRIRGRAEGIGLLRLQVRRLSRRLEEAGVHDLMRKIHDSRLVGYYEST